MLAVTSGEGRTSVKCLQLIFGVYIMPQSDHFATNKADCGPGTGVFGRLVHPSHGLGRPGREGFRRLPVPGRDREESQRHGKLSFSTNPANISRKGGSRTQPTALPDLKRYVDAKKEPDRSVTDGC